jgi:hypothetical protein
LRYAIVDGMNVRDSRVHNLAGTPRRARSCLSSGANDVSLDPLRWGLISRLRRCIVPVDGFFEWKAIKGQKAKQPYAIAMKDRAPFGIGGLWENWKQPASGGWVRTFTIITTDAYELVANIHDRMPLILVPANYLRWLSEEPDPCLIEPVSTHVNLNQTTRRPPHR